MHFDDLLNRFDAILHPVCELCNDCKVAAIKANFKDYPEKLAEQYAKDLFFYQVILQHQAHLGRQDKLRDAWLEAKEAFPHYDFLPDIVYGIMHSPYGHDLAIRWGKLKLCVQKLAKAFVARADDIKKMLEGLESGQQDLFDEKFKRLYEFEPHFKQHCQAVECFLSDLYKTLVYLPLDASEDYFAHEVERIVRDLNEMRSPEWLQRRVSYDELRQPVSFPYNVCANVGAKSYFRNVIWTDMDSRASNAEALLGAKKYGLFGYVGRRYLEVVVEKSVNANHGTLVVSTCHYF